MLDEEKKVQVQEDNLTPKETESTEAQESVESKEVSEPTVAKGLLEPAELTGSTESVEVENVKSEEAAVTSNVAVDEIEDKLAEVSENTDHPEEEVADFNNLTLEDLVETLGKLVREGQVQSINNNVNKIKDVFNLKFGTLLKIEKEKFLAEGGNVIDFQYSNPVKSTYNSILYDFKTKRNEFYANQDAKLKSNLEEKLQLIEDLKRLIDNAEGSTMYKIFKDIQKNWVEIGPIPRAKYNDTWRTYHHHIERFYDLLHLSNDLRDLDFKHNLEEKIKLVERAEALTKLEDINVAFNELQVLHKLWKEDVGPVARDEREAVWNRFSEVTKLVHDKRHEFFKDMRSKFEGNIDKKLEIITGIEAVNVSKNESRADWQKSIKEIDELRNKFFAIGQVPRSKSDEIWSKFKEATRIFNIEKNKYFKNVKKDHFENLNKKKLLIEQAESLRESEDWEMTSEVMKKIQSDWKKIGHVPRKYSDKLWKDFKGACNHFFDRLHEKQDEGNKEQIEVLNKKKDFLKELKATIESKEKVSIDNINEYVKSWRAMGSVPYEMRHIEGKFNKLLDRVVENSDLDKKDIDMLKFENLISSYLEQKNYRKLDSEQFFIRKKIDESVREIQQLENNLGFISNVTDDNPLVINVRSQINGYKDKLDVWKSKLEYLKKIEV